MNADWAESLKESMKQRGVIKMKFGVCGSLQDAPVFQENGYDYFELNFSEWAAMEEDKFQEGKKTIEAMQFYPEAMNVMLPGEFHLTGENVDLAPVAEYLKKGFDRASQLHTEVVVFGSGRARNLPEGFTDRAKAFDQLEDFLNVAGDIAASFDVTIAIEPLSFRESNIINLVSEGAYLAARVKKDSVRCLADYFHMARNKEDCESIVACAPRMEHCHIACPEGRVCPMPGNWDYTPFFEALKKANYQKRVSIECGGADWKKDAGPALKFLKSYL